MLKKVLIANRGEIAVRIIRACKELGIETVAIYSKVDKDSLHVQLADEKVCVGEAKASDSYLNMNNILSAAVSTGSDGIHPGFGFLSENEKFARLVEECGIKFIGPRPETIALMGNKSKAREMMIEAGVPVVPGSDGLVKNVEHCKELANKIGYPVLIKASSGGGGRGMRVVYEEENLAKAYDSATMEAKAAFGDESVYIEKFVVNPKHIEFQILADEYGNVIHLGERDCSVQRNNQKMIEESPSVFLDEELRKKMGDSAIKAAEYVKYINAGTVEFIVDKDKNYYFIEMNTRIQVEHPVTEMVTGIDLIKEQLKIASGEKLLCKQDEVEFNGHAIECRINAEDPLNNFRPSPGLIKELNLPGGFGVRIDTGVYQGYKVPANYDSMIIKLIVHAPTRLEAIRKMRRSLEELIVEGIITNLEFQYVIMHNPQFVRGNFDTGFVARFIESMGE